MDGNTVTPIYVTIENNRNKVQLEKNRIELLYKLFSEEFNKDYPSKINHIEYIMSVDVCANEGSLYFKQVPVWILAMLFCQGLRNVEEIQVGYVANDDAIPYLKDIKNIYKAYKPICEALKPLKFPITKMKKYMMADKLPMKYRNLIVSCENPKLDDCQHDGILGYTPCCECPPCKTVISTEYFGMDLPKVYEDKMAQDQIEAMFRKGYSMTDRDGNEIVNKNKYEYRKYSNNYDGTQLEIPFEFNIPEKGKGKWVNVEPFSVMITKSHSSVVSDEGDDEFDCKCASN
jgi:hypothetical protein